MSRRAPALYLITDRQATGGRPLLDVLSAALAAAEDFRREAGALPLAVCLREKDLTGVELTGLAKAVRQLTKIRGAELYINGRLDVALACGADGVHLPVNGPRPADVRMIAPALGIACSTHTTDEVKAAAQEGADFVVFGPIFETPSKRGLLRPCGTTAIAAASVFGIPVVALGGITPDNTDDCRAAGAAGVACIRAVLSARDPGAATLAFLARFCRRK